MRRAQSFAFIVLFCAGFVLAGAGLGAAAAEGGQSGHAAAMHGTPKYGADLSHFDYVNPDAPKAAMSACPRPARSTTSTRSF